MSNRLRALTALLTATLLAGLASAQTAPTVAQARPGGTTTATPRVSAEIFEKTRPATIRVDGRDGLGTGFFISQDGLALTAYHVVFGQTDLKAITTDRKEFALEVIAFDDFNDVALLRVKVDGAVPFIPLAKTAPRIGDAILAIGNSGGGFNTAKYGSLQALDVAAGLASFPSNTLEMTAPLRPGDSGGPIINANGEAVGVTSYIRQTSATSWNSYAVPVTDSSALVRDLRAGVKRDAPVLGISWIGYDLKDEAYEEYGLGKRPGVIVQTVTRNGPAERAGLKAIVASRDSIRADVIVEVAGKPTPTWADLLEVVRSRQIGEVVPVTVQRGSETVVLQVRLGARAEVLGSTP